MDYSAIDRLLDDVERVFKEIKIDYHLTNASIERWRWDFPEISLVWKAQDAIWRNITVLVDSSQFKATPQMDYITGRLEVNAWLDVQKDNRWIRRWQHHVVIENSSISSASLLHSYEIVSAWNPEKLTNERPLSEAASTWLDQHRG